MFLQPLTFSLHFSASIQIKYWNRSNLGNHGNHGSDVEVAAARDSPALWNV
jgi:hypothetical protein